MKKGVFLFYLILVSKAFAAFELFQPGLSECPGMRDSDVEYYQKIFDDDGLEDASEKGDIENRADSVLSYYRSDCKDKEFVKRAEKEVKNLVKKGWESEVEKYAEEIERISGFKKPEGEWQRLERFSNKLSKDPFSFVSKSEKKQFFELGAINQKMIESQCSNIDNRRKPLKNTVRDQDGIGWCYAYTAADLLSHKYGKIVSAFDVANNYNNEEMRSWLAQDVFGVRESEMEDGRIKSAIKHSVDRGVCLERNVRSSDFNFARTSELVDELKKLEEYKDSFDQSIKSSGHYSSQGSSVNAKKRQLARQKIKHKKIVDFFGDCSQLNGASWRNLFPGITNQQIIDVLFRSGKTDIINEMVKEGCRNKRVVLEDIEVKTTGILFSDSKDHLDVVDEQLNKNNIVGISYYASILREPMSEVSGGHGSSIVARRFNKSTNSCDYLVRNSWGEGCSSYSDDYDCEKGHVWIPRNQIAKGVFNVTYID